MHSVTSKWQIILPLAFVIVSGMLIFVGIVFYAGHVLTKPAREQVCFPPAELSISSISITSRSGSVIKGWFSQGHSGTGAVLLLHPVRANRCAMLGRAKFLHALGYAVLLIDLQAYGESEGERISFGYRESSDVLAAVDKLKELAPSEKLGAVGVSLGAASLVLSDAHSQLSAIVLESMYPSITEAVEDRLRIQLGEWGAVLSPVLLWQLQPLLGISPKDLRPIDRVSAIQSPILLVHGTEDRHTTFFEANRVFNRITSPKELYPVIGAVHVDLHHFATQEYESKIAEFFGQYLCGLTS